MYIKIKKFIWDNRYALFLVLSLFLYASDSCAAVFQALTDAGKNIANGLGGLVPKAAMIGLACICIGGMFGNFNWKWFAAIAIGLFVIFAAGQITELVGGSTGSGSYGSSGGSGSGAGLGGAD